MAENPRTTAARDHDDTNLIEDMIPAGDAQASSAGGRLQTDVGANDDLVHTINEPGGTTRPEKADDIANDQAYPSSKPNDMTG